MTSKKYRSLAFFVLFTFFIQSLGYSESIPLEGPLAKEHLLLRSSSKIPQTLKRKKITLSLPENIPAELATARILLEMMAQEVSDKNKSKIRDEFDWEETKVLSIDKLFDDAILNAEVLLAGSTKLDMAGLREVFSRMNLSGFYLSNDHMTGRLFCELILVAEYYGLSEQDGATIASAFGFEQDVLNSQVALSRRLLRMMRELDHFDPKDFTQTNQLLPLKYENQPNQGPLSQPNITIELNVAGDAELENTDLKDADILLAKIKSVLSGMQDQASNVTDLEASRVRSVEQVNAWIQMFQALNNSSRSSLVLARHSQIVEKIREYETKSEELLLSVQSRTSDMGKDREVLRLLEVGKDKLAEIEQVRKSEVSVSAGLADRLIGELEEVIFNIENQKTYQEDAELQDVRKNLAESLQYIQTAKAEAASGEQIFRLQVLVNDLSARYEGMKKTFGNLGQNDAKAARELQGDFQGRSQQASEDAQSALSKQGDEKVALLQGQVKGILESIKGLVDEISREAEKLEKEKEAYRNQITEKTAELNKQVESFQQLMKENGTEESFRAQSKKLDEQLAYGKSMLSAWKNPFLDEQVDASKQEIERSIYWMESHKLDFSERIIQMRDEKYRKSLEDMKNQWALLFAEITNEDLVGRTADEVKNLRETSENKSMELEEAFKNFTLAEGGKYEKQEGGIKKQISQVRDLVNQLVEQELKLREREEMLASQLAIAERISAELEVVYKNANAGLEKAETQARVSSWEIFLSQAIEYQRESMSIVNNIKETGNSESIKLAVERSHSLVRDIASIRDKAALRLGEMRRLEEKHQVEKQLLVERYDAMLVFVGKVIETYKKLTAQGSHQEWSALQDQIDGYLKNHERDESSQSEFSQTGDFLEKHKELQVLAGKLRSLSGRVGLAAEEARAKEELAIAREAELISWVAEHNLQILQELDALDLRLAGDPSLDRGALLDEVNRLTEKWEMEKSTDLSMYLPAEIDRAMMQRSRSVEELSRRLDEDINKQLRHIKSFQNFQLEAKNLSDKLVAANVSNKESVSIFQQSIGSIDNLIEKMSSRNLADKVESKMFLVWLEKQYDAVEQELWINRSNFQRDLQKLEENQRMESEDLLKAEQLKSKVEQWLQEISSVVSSGKVDLVEDSAARFDDTQEQFTEGLGRLENRSNSTRVDAITKDLSKQLTLAKEQGEILRGKVEEYKDLLKRQRDEFILARDLLAKYQTEFKTIESEMNSAQADSPSIWAVLSQQIKDLNSGLEKSIVAQGAFIQTEEILEHVSQLNLMKSRLLSYEDELTERELMYKERQQQIREDLAVLDRFIAESGAFLRSKENDLNSRVNSGVPSLREFEQEFQESYDLWKSRYADLVAIEISSELYLKKQELEINFRGFDVLLDRVHVAIASAVERERLELEEKRVVALRQEDLRRVSEVSAKLTDVEQQVQEWMQVLREKLPAAITKDIVREQKEYIDQYESLWTNLKIVSVDEAINEKVFTLEERSAAIKKLSDVYFSQLNNALEVAEARMLEDAKIEKKWMKYSSGHKKVSTALRSLIESLPTLVSEVEMKRMTAFLDDLQEIDGSVQKEFDLQQSDDASPTKSRIQNEITNQFKVTSELLDKVKESMQLSLEMRNRLAEWEEAYRVLEAEIRTSAQRIAIRIFRIKRLAPVAYWKHLESVNGLLSQEYAERFVTVQQNQNPETEKSLGQNARQAYEQYETLRAGLPEKIEFSQLKWRERRMSLNRVRAFSDRVQGDFAQIEMDYERLLNAKDEAGLEKFVESLKGLRNQLSQSMNEMPVPDRGILFLRYQNRINGYAMRLETILSEATQRIASWIQFKDLKRSAVEKAREVVEYSERRLIELRDRSNTADLSLIRVVRDDISKESLALTNVLLEVERALIETDSQEWIGKLEAALSSYAVLDGQVRGREQAEELEMIRRANIIDSSQAELKSAERESEKLSHELKGIAGADLKDWTVFLDEIKSAESRVQEQLKTLEQENLAEADVMRDNFKRALLEISSIKNEAMKNYEQERQRLQENERDALRVLSVINLGKEKLTDAQSEFATLQQKEHSGAQWKDYLDQTLAVMAGMEKAQAQLDQEIAGGLQYEDLETLRSLYSDMSIFTRQAEERIAHYEEKMRWLQEIESRKQALRVALRKLDEDILAEKKGELRSARELTEILEGFKGRYEILKGESQDLMGAAGSFNLGGPDDIDLALEQIPQLIDDLRSLRDQLIIAEEAKMRELSEMEAAKVLGNQIQNEIDQYQRKVEKLEAKEKDIQRLEESLIEYQTKAAAEILALPNTSESSEVEAERRNLSRVLEQVAALVDEVKLRYATFVENQKLTAELNAEIQQSAALLSQGVKNIEDMMPDRSADKEVWISYERQLLAEQGGIQKTLAVFEASSAQVDTSLIKDIARRLDLISRKWREERERFENRLLLEESEIKAVKETHEILLSFEERWAGIFAELDSPLFSKLIEMQTALSQDLDVAEAKLRSVENQSNSSAVEVIKEESEQIVGKLKKYESVLDESIHQLEIEAKQKARAESGAMDILRDWKKLLVETEKKAEAILSDDRTGMQLFLNRLRSESEKRSTEFSYEEQMFAESGLDVERNEWLGLQAQLNEWIHQIESRIIALDEKEALIRQMEAEARKVLYQSKWTLQELQQSLVLLTGDNLSGIHTFLGQVDQSKDDVLRDLNQLSSDVTSPLIWEVEQSVKQILSEIDTMKEQAEAFQRLAPKWDDVRVDEEKSAIQLYNQVKQTLNGLKLEMGLLRNAPSAKLSGILSEVYMKRIGYDRQFQGLKNTTDSSIILEIDSLLEGMLNELETFQVGLEAILKEAQSKDRRWLVR